MNIAFIIPLSPGRRNIIRLIDCSHEAKTDYLWQPNDFMLISSLLEPGDSAELIDGTADCLSDDEFNEHLARIEPDIVFFALSGVCWESDYGFFKKARNLFPKTRFFVIGDIFREKDYLSLILRDSNGVVFNPFALDLREMTRGGSPLPGVWTDPEQTGFPGGKKISYARSGFPRHELFIRKGYCFPFSRHLRFSTVTTMWGCPFECSYCPDAGLPPVVRRWQDIIGELQYLESLGIRELNLADKTFGFPHGNAVSLLKEMAGRFNFSWTCYLQPMLYEEELLELMKSAGCHTIIVGIETADTESLSAYGRHIEAGRLNALLTHAERLGISVCGDFIIGLEHETEDDIRKTIDYALGLPIDFASFNIAAPFPGTTIRQRTVDSGKMSRFKDEGFDSLGRNGFMGVCPVSPERIIRLRNEAVRRFYLRPSYVLGRLAKTASFEHLLIQARQLKGMFSNLLKIQGN